MGSGKSTVGPLLARDLGWGFVDADEALEAEEGRSIPEIFRDDGEEGFRRAEHEVMLRLLALDDIVIASGGGWPCVPGRIEELGADTLSIWMRVGADGVLDRTRRSATRRPLLEVDDPPARIRELLDAREPFYRKARWSVDTETHSPSEMARRVIQHLHDDAERPLHI